jgi:hypothetical protein
MFTRHEWLARLPSLELALVNRPQPPIESIEFTPEDFPSNSSEEFIRICRGAKPDFKDAMHFWVVAQRQQNWTYREEHFLTYLSTAVCQPLKEEEFAAMLSQTRGLKHPVVFTAKGKYVWGQKMSDEWDDTSALAEFEHEYLSFQWETTA